MARPIIEYLVQSLRRKFPRLDFSMFSDIQLWLLDRVPVNGHRNISSDCFHLGVLLKFLILNRRAYLRFICLRAMAGFETSTGELNSSSKSFDSFDQNFLAY
jgi:hypothetical protein